jgi:hypothetical protein
VNLREEADSFLQRQICVNIRRTGFSSIASIYRCKRSRIFQFELLFIFLFLCSLHDNVFEGFLVRISADTPIILTGEFVVMVYLSKEILIWKEVTPCSTSVHAS